jgi:hypothetical protein
VKCASSPARAVFLVLWQKGHRPTCAGIPLFHQHAASVEQIAAGVSRLNLVADRVRQRDLGDFPRRPPNPGMPTETSEPSRAETSPSPFLLSSRPRRAPGNRYILSGFPRQGLEQDDRLEQDNRGRTQPHAVLPRGFHN